MTMSAKLSIAALLSLFSITENLSSMHQLDGKASGNTLRVETRQEKQAHSSIRVNLTIRKRGIWVERNASYNLPILTKQVDTWVDIYGIVHHSEMWNTFLPIAPVINILSQCGYSSSWDKKLDSWNFPNDGIVGPFPHDNLGIGIGTVQFTAQTVDMFKHIPLIYKNGQAYLPLDVFKFVLSILPGVISDFDAKNYTWSITGSPLVSADTQGSSPVYLGPGGARNPYEANENNNIILKRALNDAKSSFNQSQYSIQYTPFSSKTQWFSDPKDIFYNKYFPVTELRSGAVLQKNPLVIVEPYSQGSGSAWILEYVGWNQTPDQLTEKDDVGWPSHLNTKDYYTYWKAEQATLTPIGKSIPAGLVIDVTNQLSQVRSLWGQFLQGDPSQGVNIKGNYPISYYWAIGSGVTALPIPNWNPNKKLQGPWNTYANWANVSN